MLKRRLPSYLSGHSINSIWRDSEKPKNGVYAQLFDGLQGEYLDKHVAVKNRLLRFFDRGVKNNTLDLNNHHLTSDDISYLIEYLNQHPEITILILNNNCIGNSGALELAKINTIKELHLEHCNITNKGIVGFIENTSITYLNLSKNGIDESDDSASQLAEKNKSLKKLELNTNHINQSAVTLAKNITLNYLDLRFNEITEENAKKIILYNKTSKSLLMANNEFNVDIFFKQPKKRKLNKSKSQKKSTNARNQNKAKF